MSPALIDIVAPAHHPFHPSLFSNKGQISSPFVSEVSGSNSKNCQLASSFHMNPYGQSGFGSSSEMNPNFDFSFRAAAKPDPQKPMFSSSSGLSRPRIAKQRKSANSRTMGGSETQEIDPGSNPFHPVVNNLFGVSSRLESDQSAEFGGQRAVLGDDHASISRSNPLNLNVTSSKVEKVGNELVGEISKLRIDSQSDSHIDDHKAKTFSERGSAAFSGSERIGENPVLSELSDDIKKLNLRSSVGESSKISGISQDNFGSNRGGGFSHSQNAGGLFGRTMASELPNDLKKLNIKDSSEVDGRTFVFGATSKSEFVFGESKKNNVPVAPGIASTLPDKIKNLNIDDSHRTNDAQKDRNVKHSDQIFGSGKSRTGTSFGGVIDPMILDEMENLKIGDRSEGSGDNANIDNPSALRTDMCGNMSKEDNAKLNHAEITAQFTEQGKDANHHGASEIWSNKGSELRQPSASSSSSTSFHFPADRDEFRMPCMDGANQKAAFSFNSQHDSVNIPHFEFRTQDPKGNLCSVSNKNMEFSGMKGSINDTLSKGTKTKPKEHTSVFMSLGRESASEESSSQHDTELSEPSSPMDFSPYQESQDDNCPAKDSSFTAENQPSNVSQTMYSNDVIDEDLVSATESMDIINKDNEAKNDEAEVSGNDEVAMENSPEDSFSAVETESFMTAPENFDRNGEIEVDSNGEVESCDRSQYFSAASSTSSRGGAFIFAATPSYQGQSSAASRHHKKKSRMKAGLDVFIPSRVSALSDATSSSSQFSPISRVSMLLSPGVHKNSASTVPQKGSISPNVSSSASKAIGCSYPDDTRKEDASLAARAAQEACEQWRLRGNQAYSNGDSETAEDYYTQGLGCIPKNETSRDCLRSLMLCYSNRAAARTSLGRMREALHDCMRAAEIDPNFFRVQLRAANCYLALGEVGNASEYFNKLLKSTDACMDQKLILEASDGLQKAQKVSECMDLSAKLLQQRTVSDVERALGFITEAIVISPYSEQLLAQKAESLFMLHRYEEVISLCEQTMAAADKNCNVLGASSQSQNLEASDLLNNYSFRIWRYSLIFKSNFYLGKLEEAFNFLEKQEKWRLMVDKYGNETVELLIPQLSTARELMRLKAAGNVAFQAGRHTDAVEHYTAALSFKVEPRPFAAVCFGNRAAAYQALGQLTDAIADCSLAIALDRNYLKAISRRAVLFEMIRDYDQAVKDLQSVVSLLTKQAEGKANQMGTYVSTSSVADLRQARQRLYQMEEQTKKDIPLNFYLILGVEPSVSAGDLKKAYRKAALKHHPDKAGQSLARSDGGDDGLWKEISEEVHRDANRLFKMIGEAYAVLSDPIKRSQYDAEEEMRNGQRRGTPRMHTDTPFNTEERSGARQWREGGWRPSINPYYRGFDPARSSRYY